jgi:hypothetical protein
VISIAIDGESRLLNDADRGWVVQAVERSRRQGNWVCIKVSVERSDWSLDLTTFPCRDRDRGRRPAPLSELARDLLILWNAMGLDAPDFRDEKLLAFLSILRQFESSHRDAPLAAARVCN